VIPSRPIVRYHGGKWRIAPWIISFFPEHRCYIEPFGGGGSILIRKSRSYAEIYNDLDGEIVNLFRMARDRGPELVQAVELTPFAREEFLDSWEPCNDDLERARRILIRGYMGFGSAATTKDRGQKSFRTSRETKVKTSPTGFRNNSTRSGSTPASDWRNYPGALASIVDRLRGVTIENRDALHVMRQHDAPTTLHYVDPPYVSETRDDGRDYRHEYTTQQHRELAECLHQLKGCVILSGYDCDLYRELYSGWERRDRDTIADGGQKRTEVLWIKNGSTGMNFDQPPATGKE